MKNATSVTLRIAEPESEANLSKGQKLFNSLIKQIEAQRKKLEKWQAATAAYEQKQSSDYLPLLDSFEQHRVMMLQLFDQAYAKPGLSRREKQMLGELICDIASDILSANPANEEAKEVYNRYSHADFDTETEEKKAFFKEQLGRQFGFDIDDDADLSSPEDFLRMLHEHLKKEQEQKEEAEKMQREAGQNAGQSGGKRKQPKKSAKQAAKEAKEQEHEQNISQSIRDVFRKLASALHPDREQDPVERDRKNALMQRVNVAYGSKDLLKLLELQLEVEQIDQAAINTLSDGRLKYYNQILSGQLHELTLELHGLEYAFRIRNNFTDYGALTAAKLMKKLQEEIGALQLQIRQLKSDFRTFGNVKELKKFIKNYRAQSPFDDDGYY
jgi:hypothetical protein